MRPDTAVRSGRRAAPDRVFDGPVHVATDRLFLQYGTQEFEKLADGRYRMKLVDHDGKATAVSQSRLPGSIAHSVS